MVFLFTKNNYFKTIFNLINQFILWDYKLYCIFKQCKRIIEIFSCRKKRIKPKHDIESAIARLYHAQSRVRVRWKMGWIRGHSGYIRNNFYTDLDGVKPSKSGNVQTWTKSQWHSGTRSSKDTWCSIVWRLIRFRKESFRCWDTYSRWNTEKRWVKVRNSFKPHEYHTRAIIMTSVFVFNLRRSLWWTHKSPRCKMYHTV